MSVLSSRPLPAITGFSLSVSKSRLCSSARRWLSFCLRRPQPKWHPDLRVATNVLLFYRNGKYLFANSFIPTVFLTFQSALATDATGKTCKKAPSDNIINSRRVDERRVDEEISFTGLSLANNDFQEKQTSLFTRLLLK